MYFDDSITSQGNLLDNVTSQFENLNFKHKKLIHTLNNLLSYIDLIFTSRPNLIIESGVYLSLHPNCHHQKVYAKFDLQINYTPQYFRDVCHYKYAIAELSDVRSTNSAGNKRF